MVGWFHRGYVILHVRGRGDIPEHRLVMEQVLGRRLDAMEVVHHRNGVKHDNRLSNLELMAIGDHHRKHQQGRIFSNLTREKMRRAQRGRTLSDATKAKIRAAGQAIHRLGGGCQCSSHQGRSTVISPEVRRKISVSLSGRERPDLRAAQMGRILSAETRAKISTAQRRSWASAERKGRSL